MAEQFTPVVGKDVIESLTLGMYEDSRSIFREYIQNSADQIDKAITLGVLKKGEGEIHIDINPAARRILIEDNATGITRSEVSAILQNIAQSTKERGVDRGFRGIGRLGGLAYCESLIFETSFSGEPTKSVLRWDAALLRKIINNRTTKEDAASVIKTVTKLENTEEEAERHYFKVILEKVTNDEILNRNDVEKYLSLVAPLPFGTKFYFKSKIEEQAKADHISIDDYKIFLNTDQLFKGYLPYIYKGDEENKRKEDEITDILFFKATASDGKPLYWGWHSLSGKLQSLERVNYARGFRLKKSNIQIGDSYTLQKLHRDTRFQFYFFGEVHALHPELIPNSRRDYFIENEIQAEFEQHLKTYFHTEVSRICRTASDVNSSIRRIEEFKSLDAEFREKKDKGFTNKEEHSDYIEKWRKKKEEASKAQERIRKIEKTAVEEQSEPITKILKRAATINAVIGEKDIADDKKPKFRVDRLSRLDKEQRKFLSQIFGIIRDVLDQDTAENLIQKIEEELK